jgi:hypothetical protein
MQYFQQVNFEVSTDTTSPSTMTPMLNVFDNTGTSSAIMFNITAANPFMMMTMRTSMLRPGWSDVYVTGLH